ncbi:DUF4169 domain-containing protein [Sulfitobacter alexandrii]|uniref:DUF4169 domain-containing protein n=1 Tax=Sulfitobacter alexandrii TaxID=1917485 RepID=A0A1J0WG60_9RHOB|nr:DUF4169 family protein [Sulfitobacter alexandrii]APE43291.1 DUF4169 domain-containing protein [Sulfitobacter alexandrii]
MSEGPINLNKARKARAKALKRRQADENAVAFGRPKAQKRKEQAEAERARRDLDGHKRET